MSAEGTAKSLTVLIKKAKTYEVFINAQFRCESTDG